MPSPALSRYTVLPSTVQNKSYPLYDLRENGDLLLQGDKESCYIYLTGWMAARIDERERLIESHSSVIESLRSQVASWKSIAEGGK